MRKTDTAISAELQESTLKAVVRTSSVLSNKLQLRPKLAVNILRFY